MQEMFEAQPAPVTLLPTLLRQALDDARDLAKLEVQLARIELREEIDAAKHAGIGVGAGTVLAISGITMLFVAIALALSPTWLPALLVGIIVLAAAGIAGLLAYRAVPKRPLDRTRRRAITDLHMLAERTA